MFHHATGHEQLTERIIGCAIAVHSILGAGLLESIYDDCLASELTESHLSFEWHRPVPVIYKNRRLGQPLIPDFIIDGMVVIEVKAVEVILPVHISQVITYLKLTGCPIGLLINFNVPSLRSGIRRLYNPDMYKKNRP